VVVNDADENDVTLPVAPVVDAHSAGVEAGVVVPVERCVNHSDRVPEFYPGITLPFGVKFVLISVGRWIHAVFGRRWK
jgi:hypothetical protein